MMVPSGALTNPPVPVFTFTWPVSVWFEPTWLNAWAGVIWMLASTNVFTASGVRIDPPVWTVNETPLTVRVEDAWPVTFPGVGEVKVIVHCPFASVFWPAVVQLPVGAVWLAPFE